MNRRNSSKNKDQEQSNHKKNRIRPGLSSRKKEVNEHRLDEAIKMTFPASDPIAIIQPPSDKERNPKTATQSNNPAPRANNK